MKIETNSEVLTVRDMKELAAGNADSFRSEMRSALLPAPVKAIEVDLSQTEFLDSCGLGALISVYKMANGQNGSVPVRLMNPTASIQQLLELTRLHRIFEIVNT